MKIISYVHQKYLKNRFKKGLKKYKGIHYGNRCFIIGNGPSLLPEDLDKLKNEYTFASNRIYGIFDRTEWRPTYYASQDGEVIADIKNEFLRMSEESKACFFNGKLYRSYSKELKKRPNVNFFQSYTKVNESGMSEISEDITNGINNGFTVTFGMIQIAIYMGFKELYLLGVDNNYSHSVDSKGNVTVNNKIKDYFTGIAPLKNGRIQAGRTEDSDMSYRSARKYADEHGIKIYNATRGGKVETFERVDFDELSL